jgi:hypothetical protein
VLLGPPPPRRGNKRTVPNGGAPTTLGSSIALAYAAYGIAISETAMQRKAPPLFSSYAHELGTRAKLGLL